MKVIEDKELRISQLIKEFDERKYIYDEFEECLNNLIKQLLKHTDAAIHAVSSRRKGRDSFISKINKPGKAYANISEITDLVGIRITTYFESEVDKVKDIIERELEIDTENSVDKRKLHDPDRFGYMSLHYVVKLTPSRLSLPEYSSFKDMKAEIQIRSILQHTWAEIEHDLGYKSKYSVPKNLKRRFSQLSSLLELADREFLEIRKGISDYEGFVVSCLDINDREICVDKNSVGVISTHLDLIKSLDIEIAKITNANITENHDFSETLSNMLLYLKIEKVSDLKALIDKHASNITDFANNWIHQKNYKEFNNGISIMYTCYLHLATQMDVNSINDFASKFELGRHVSNFGEHLLDIYSKTATQQ